MDRVHFVVPGNPVGKGRPIMSRRNGQLRAVTPAKTRAYEATVATYAKEAMQGHPPFQGACALSIVAYMAIPKSWPKWKRRAAMAGKLHPTSKPDWDNIGKTTDAIGGKPKRGKRPAVPGIVWSDDAHITQARVVKLYSAEPRVEISVVHLEAGERGVKFIAPEAA